MMKEVRVIVKKLSKDGWEIVSKKKHIKMRHPIYGTQIIPSTPGDFHWRENLLKQIEHKYKAQGARMI